MAKAGVTKSRIEAKIERAQITDRIEVLYEVGLSIQVGVDGCVPGMSEDERKQVLLENVLVWLSTVGEFAVGDPASAASKILAQAEEIYEGEEIIDVTVS